MTKVIQLNHLKDKENLLNKLMNKEIMVYEDVQGSKIYVRWTGEQFIIAPKSIKNEPLNFIDLATQKYYNSAYVYLHTLPDYVTNLLNQNWWFCFEYFPDTQPAHIQYGRLPKNSLILSCIVKQSKYTYNIEELVEYSNLFNVDMLPILFKGKLSPKQVEVITLFLNTSEEDLKFVFNETNFAHFFYKILNPLENNSFLMNDNEFNSNLEKVILKIDGDSKYTFEILNPLYQKMKINNNTEYINNYSIIILNFLEFFQLNGIEKYKPLNITKDKLYVDFICLLYNEYVDNCKDDLLKWDFVIPQFFNEDKFKINYDLLNDKKTISYIKSDPKLEYIFKVILHTFNRKKKKPFGLITEKILVLLNNTIDKISNYLDTLLQANREYKFQNTDLLNFNDYFNIKYNTDSTGKIYIQDDKVSDKEEMSDKGKDKKKMDNSKMKKGG